MPTYSTPGAYIEWQDASAPAIQPLRTDITGFIGLAQRGPLNTPVPVESVKQFEAHFGSFIGGGFLAYAVRGFFENGGRRCWIARVAAREASRPATAASLVWQGLGVPRWRVEASGPGVWGNGLTLSISAIYPARTFTVAGEPSTRWVNVASVASFSRADLFELEVSDDGAGLDGALDKVKASPTLERMRQRLSLAGGDLHIHSTRDRGIRVVARAKLEAENAQEQGEGEAP